MRTFILIGHPVGHSLSPAIHAAAYSELGLSGCEYVARDCANESSVEQAFTALRSGELSGANVTVPWKRLALSLADEVDGSAQSTGAANVLVPVHRHSGRVVAAYNTDVPALAAELDLGHPHARSALIIGSGGAALAAIAACRSLGASRIALTARRFRRAGEEASGSREFYASLGVEIVGWPDSAIAREEFREVARSSNLVIQSTTDGMVGATDGTTVRDVVPWNDLDAGAFVYDVVYNPAVTPFVEAARARGLSAENGLGMLVGQAALAVELWLGTRPRAEPLLLAARAALAAKGTR